MPVDEYQAPEETVLSDAPTLEAIQAGLDDLARGDTIELDEHESRPAPSRGDTRCPRCV